MRRSLAPSQLAGPSKKPRLETNSAPSSKALTPFAKKPVLTENSTPKSSTSFRSSQDILALLEKKPSTSNPEEQPKPAVSVSTPKQYLAQVSTPRPTDGNSDNENIKYFNVFWCKASAKKHKNWEEEAVLVVKTRAVILKNLEGKEIGQASGFKLAELQKLESGSTLKVGGREVLIQEQIDEATYLKLKNGSVSTSKEPSAPATPLTKPRTIANKNFVPPASRNASDELSDSRSVEIKPRHNPAGSNALVMPRPPSDIQWREAQKGTVIVDVVVDPLLCKHLRPHQKEGVTFLYECLMGYKTSNMYGAVLADEMGLGKTLQCITVIWTLLNQGPYNGRPVVQRVLIVAPSSLVKNWQKEFRRWLGRERLEVFTADQQNRPVEFLKQRVSRVMIVSYEMFLRSFDEIQQVNFDLIVCDEGHRLKNSGNKTSSLLAQLDTDRKVLLTGTPVQNDLKEFYALADFVNPGIFGTLSSFRRTYEEPILALQLPNCPRDVREIGENCAAELSHVTSKFVLRRTQEVMSAHLPPKVENVIFCQPSNMQIEMYHSLLDSSACRSLLSSTYSGNDLLGFIQTLRKLCNHPMLFTSKNEGAKESPSRSVESDFDDDSNDGFLNLYETAVRKDNYDSASIEDAGKFMVTLQILDSIMQLTREKIVLVSYSTKMLDLFGEACTQRKYGWLRLDGSTQATTRMGLVDKFNDPTGSERVFLLSSKAGGVGLNLIGASRLVLYDIDWNPANDLQAMARIWRDGQKRTVHIYRLLTTGTIEEKIFQRQVLKQGLSGAVVDSRDSSKGHFTRDELRDLFTLREDTECDTHDLIQCHCCSEDGDSPSIEPDEQDAGLDDERDCQIGTAPTKGKEAHKTVDQLMDWRHYAPPFYDGAFEDTCMDAARDYITFVFRCTSGFDFE